VSYGFVQWNGGFENDHLVGSWQYRGLSTHSVFPSLRLPFLKRIIVKSPITLAYGEYYSSLPFLAPFLVSIPSISPVSDIRLCLHLRFGDLTSLPGLRGLDWSDVATFLVLPVFRHPIELYISRKLFKADVFVSSFEHNSDIKRLLESGKLIIRNDEE
jgi:hypothetical protein